MEVANLNTQQKVLFHEKIKYQVNFLQERKVRQLYIFLSITLNIAGNENFIRVPLHDI